MFLKECKNKYRYAGFIGLLTFIGFRLANVFAYFDCLRTMTLEDKDIDNKYKQSPEGLEIRFLSETEILEYSRNPDYQLTDDFLGRALENGDRCLAILDGDKLASYGWYSTKPTKVTGQFQLHFSNQWVYMHHGYTNPNYRGKRLHAIGMARATKLFTEMGYKGLVSIVASENAASLKSTRRLGYRENGKIFLFARMNRYLVMQSIGARRAGLYMSAMDESFNSIVLNKPQEIQVAS